LSVVESGHFEFFFGKESILISWGYELHPIFTPIKYLNDITDAHNKKRKNNKRKAPP
jgi:hypothetical protein